MMYDLQIITREDIETALNECEPDAYEVDWSYSGRAMYGRACFGVTPNGRDFDRPASATTLMYRAWVSAYQRATDGDDPDVYDTAEFLDQLAREERTDNMGYDTIHYWPDLNLEVLDEG